MAELVSIDTHIKMEKWTFRHASVLPYEEGLTFSTPRFSWKDR